MYIVTTGIGLIDQERPSSRPTSVRPGDKVIVSGTIGDHGVAIMWPAATWTSRPTSVRYRAAARLVAGAVDAAGGVRAHARRDPGRGRDGTQRDRHGGPGRLRPSRSAAVRAEVGAPARSWGSIRLYVANEGKLVAFVAAEQAEAALAAMRAHPLGGDAAIIGERPRSRPASSSDDRIRRHRIVDLLSATRCRASADAKGPAPCYGRDCACEGSRRVRACGALAGKPPAGRWPRRPARGDRVGCGGTCR